MPSTSVLGGISSEATQEQLLSQTTLLLSQILEKLPRTDTMDRLIVNASEVNPTVAIAASQTLGTVTNVNQVANQGVDFLQRAFSNAGAQYLYNNIIVS
jgi:hypothetical protein